MAERQPERRSWTYEDWADRLLGIPLAWLNHASRLCRLAFASSLATGLRRRKTKTLSMHHRVRHSTHGGHVSDKRPEGRSAPNTSTDHVRVPAVCGRPFDTHRLHDAWNPENEAGGAPLSGFVCTPTVSSREGPLALHVFHGKHCSTVIRWQPHAGNQGLRCKPTCVWPGARAEAGGKIASLLPRSSGLLLVWHQDRHP